MNLPTKITVFRILIVPVIWIVLLVPYLPEIIRYSIVFTLFTIASISDFLDGYIARKYNMITSLGKFLDPIADKVLVNSVFIFLAYHNKVNLILVLLMITRDTLVDALRMNASEKGIVISAKLLGKLKTVFQMLAIAIGLFPIDFGIADYVTIIATIVSLISGLDYFLTLRKDIF